MDDIIESQQIHNRIMTQTRLTTETVVDLRRLAVLHRNANGAENAAVNELRALCALVNLLGT
jgi:hypothetical protein